MHVFLLTGGQAPEAEGHLGDDVHEEVVIILEPPIPTGPSRHLDNLQDDLVGQGVERPHDGGGVGPIQYIELEAKSNMG